MKKISNIHPWMVAASMMVVIGLLASICAVFPEEGVVINDSLELRFPTLTEMLKSDTTTLSPEAQLTPEQLLAQREQEMKMQEEQQYVDFFTKNPVRIHFPGNDFTYLDEVYEALDNARNHPVHIVHYGDSQLEEDRIACNLRLALQKQFGGGGNGLLPWQESLYSQTVNLYSETKPQRHQIYGPKSNRRDSSRYYGPMGNVSLLNGTMTLTVSPKKRQGDLTVSHYFNQLTVLSRSEKPLTISAQGKTTTVPPTPSNTTMQMGMLTLKDSTTTVSITLNGEADIYGFILENNKGVSVDNIAMRGCSGTIFTGIDALQLMTYFRETDTRLVIMQFGGNSMPYLKEQKGIDRYVEQLRRQIKHMKRMAPKAKILWIGPSDMTTKINGQMRTYPLLKTVDQAICKMVNEEGCAYWSLFESMGGAGSMVRWANAQPALAGKDYIHFTRLGATKAGELLTEAFLTGYRYYDFRRPVEEVEEAVETAVPEVSTVQEVQDAAEVAVSE